jgi:hypothetical protein
VNPSDNEGQMRKYNKLKSPVANHWKRKILPGYILTRIHKHSNLHGHSWMGFESHK